MNLAILTPSLGPLNHVTFEYFGVFEMKHQIDRDLEATVFFISFQRAPKNYLTPGTPPDPYPSNPIITQTTTLNQVYMPVGIGLNQRLLKIFSRK